MIFLKSSTEWVIHILLKCCLATCLSCPQQILAQCLLYFRILPKELDQSSKMKLILQQVLNHIPFLRLAPLCVEVTALSSYPLAVLKRLEYVCSDNGISVDWRDLILVNSIFPLRHTHKSSMVCNKLGST